MQEQDFTAAFPKVHGQQHCRDPDTWHGNNMFIGDQQQREKKCWKIDQKHAQSGRDIRARFDVLRKFRVREQPAISGEEWYLKKVAQAPTDGERYAEGDHPLVISCPFWVRQVKQVGKIGRGSGWK